MNSVKITVSINQLPKWLFRDLVPFFVQWKIDVRQPSRGSPCVVHSGATTPKTGDVSFCEFLSGLSLHGQSWGVSVHTVPVLDCLLFLMLTFFRYIGIRLCLLPSIV